MHLAVQISTLPGVPVATNVAKVKRTDTVQLSQVYLFSFCPVPHLIDKGKVEVFKKTGSEIGKTAATKSGGLFSADDWQCSM